MMRATRKRRPRGQPVDPITAESLRDGFAKYVLRGHLRMPADAELKELARVLEHWRRVFQNEEILRHRRELQGKALVALESLSKIVSKIAELDIANLHAAARDSAPAGVLHTLGERAKAINDVRSIIRRVGNSPGLITAPASYGATGWQWLADALRVDFARAMKPANPALVLTYRAPLARFIAAVAPLLTGEHPSPASITTQLKMRRKARRQAAVKNCSS